MKKIILLSMILLNVLTADIYYISPYGNDSTGEGSEQDPWQTLRHGFSEMQGGDTLYMLEGIYTGAGNVINVYDGIDTQPPSGSVNGYTLISAVPGAHVYINGESIYEIFTISARSYIKFNHITWMNSAGGNVIHIHDDAGEIHHIILKNCGAIGSQDEKDAGEYGISGSNYSSAPDQRLTHHILIEDCWGAGAARIVLTIWRCENVVIRRFVGRWDYHTYIEGRPEGGTTSYESANVSFQNCILLDGNQNPDNYGGYGSMGTAQHTDDFPIDGLEFLGNIALNWYGGFLLENDDSTTMRNVVVKNNVFWEQKREGKAAFSIAGGNKENVVIENNTIAHSVEYGVYTSSESVASGNIVLRSSLIYNNAGTALMGSPYLSTEYLNVYGNGNVGNIPGPNSIYEDPQMKYIITIEESSPCSGMGYNGSDIGANVYFRYGRDGSFWGDEGYNELSDVPLWPFPNEDIIKADFSISDNRGFCAEEETLTHYIWNYLGNGCLPCEFWEKPPELPDNPAAGR